ncbi:restriction endonuclease subunit S [Prosthecobacter dejongeii]|uniref:Type I restriction enzyme S subunit n=1 Tax=Prosthecobacter dejongeii TaxID=48465 RepID=A0A7W7YP94_9BACT|nr:restriction endonuclease subunit S [Prosthecobacter dejongeii]MBB5039833.1 type I restriction enzyme S subunit [Prosthecobacter dejongeii]
MIKLEKLLEDAEVFNDGDWVETKDQDPSGAVRLTQLADIGVGYWVDKSSRFMTKETAVELKCTFLKKGDVLLARMPDPIGRCCEYPGGLTPAVTVVDVCIMRPNPHKIAPRYLMHALNAPVFSTQIHQHVTGTTRQRISRGNLKTLSVPMPFQNGKPNLDEQKRIAAILDKADAIRRKRQQALRLTDDFLRSVFLDMFGDPGSNPHSWKVKRLADLIPDDDVINYGVVQPGEHVPGGIPLIRAGDVDAEVQEPQRLKQISQEIDKQYDRSRLHGGEVLIGCVGAVGSTMIAGPKLAGANIARAVARINLRADIQAEYILGLLRMPHLQNYFQNEIRVVAQPTLNIKQIKETPVMLPPENLRKQFTAIFRKAKDAHAIARKAELQSSALFSSLQQRAFSGLL